MNATSRTQSSAAGGTPVTEVGEYAGQVRVHLAGLPAEQVDDLTDGLEADLAEALEDAPGEGPDERGDLVARFGPPAAYARELRVAAGLPEPDAATGARGAGARLRSLPAAARRVGLRATADLRAQPWWPGVRDFLVSLRPVWWLLRAWVVYQMILTFPNATPGGLRRGWVPADPATIALFLVLAVVSVQWGRGQWRSERMRPLSAAVSLLAVLLLPLAVIEADHGSVRWQTEYQYVDDGVAQSQREGVWVDGMQVSNLFVYDEDGNPLTDVQVYDDRGRPVRTIPVGMQSGWSLPGVTEPWTFAPREDEDGRARWNAYPLLGAPDTSFDWYSADQGGPVLLPGESLHRPPRPFAKAPALVPSTDDATPADGDAAQEGSEPQPSAGPTAGATAGPPADPAADPAGSAAGEPAAGGDAPATP